MSGAAFAILSTFAVLLIVASALFSGLETALFSLKPHQLLRLEKNHPPLAQFIRDLRAHPRRVLNFLVVGDTIVNVPLVILCLALVWQGGIVTTMPQWVVTFAIFSIIVFFCDLLPKVLALAAPYRLSAVGVWTLRTLVPLFEVIGNSLERFSSRMLECITPRHLRSRTHLSDDELETLVEIGAEQGQLHEAEGEMIQEIIKLGDKTAKDCMTPRVDTFALADDLTNDEAIAELKKNRHRRVPVYADTPDQVVGIIDVKQFLLDPSEHYTEALVAPSFVPETMKALDLLRSFLTHPQGLAIVVDEFGGTEGVVTLADIVEDIIGDAAPLGDADLYIEPLAEGKLLVNGKARLDDLHEHLGFELEADGIDTIGGYVFTRVGSLPAVGARVEFPRLTATIRRVSRKRIEEMLIEPHIHGATVGEMENLR